VRSRNSSLVFRGETLSVGSEEAGIDKEEGIRIDHEVGGRI
jgi:hypothetical protein